nr:MAG TPA: hypothetical protein [Caudoviricetes sp.]
MQYPKRVRYTVYPVRLGRVSARGSLFLCIPLGVVSARK